MKSWHWINEKFLIPFLWIILLGIVTVLLWQNEQAEQKQIKILKENVISNAISHFEDVVMTRKWNASHGGVFVIEHDGIKPNPYLKDNVTYTSDNKKMIKINPAWMTRQLSEISNASRNEKFKITSLKPINPVNKPNAFETEALQEFDKRRTQKYYYRFDQNEKFHFMGVLYVEDKCLTCHAEQGYKIGDVRGGISIELPNKAYEHSKQLIHSSTQKSRLGIIISSALIGLLMSYVIVLIARRHRSVMDTNQRLEEMVETRTLELKHLNETLEERVKEEIAKNKSKEEMMILQSRHAAMGEMISMIAHQWRQPVSTLTMIANQMVMDIGLEEVDMQEFEKRAEEIIAQSVYLSNTIDDFTNFFKPNKERELFSPAEVMDEALKLIDKSLENNSIEYHFDIRSDIRMSGYPSELMQVYLNLLKNAKEALIESSRESKTISIAISSPDDSILIRIGDNGNGIDENIKEQIFNPYFTTKEEYNGTGLGLYMSKIIVEKHFKGKIWVEREGDETVFYLQIPLA